ncbi:hypothetical protein MASR2M15_15030 [Anaerolineales bacterium]
MRGRQSEWEAQGLNVILLNIQESPGNQMLEKFDFKLTPTYILYDSKGKEVWRGQQIPDLKDFNLKA